MDKRDRSRTHWIDVLKGLGIILVVIGHVSLHNGLSSWIYTFHMQLFFALSGFLWGRSTNKYLSFKEFSVKKVKTILWPFIFFRILLILYWLVIESHFRELDLGPIWFLIVLFGIEMIAFLFMRNFQNNIAYNTTLILCLSVMWYILKLFIPENTMTAWLLRLLNGMLWYMIGSFLHILILKIKKMPTSIQFWNGARRQKYLILIALLIMSILISINNSGVSMWSNTYGERYLLYLGGSIVGIILISLFCKWVVIENAILEFLGQNTIVIIATHEPIKRVVLKVLEFCGNKLGFQISTNELQVGLLSSLMVVLVVLFLNVLVVYLFRFIKRKLPRIIQENLLIFVR